jgi:hypothetical protein
MSAEFEPVSENDRFLAVTAFCDHDHPEIVRRARILTKGIEDPVEQARAIFCWVRDDVAYRIGFWNRSASETLCEREGTCTNKANLLVALLRACGIPAAFGVLDVKGQEYFGPGLVPFYSSRVRKVSRHFYAAVHLDRWIKLDPSDDRAIVEAVSTMQRKKAGSTEQELAYKLVEWDGRSDAQIDLDPDHVLADHFPFADIDGHLRRESVTARMFVFELANEGMRALRRTGVQLHSPRQVLPFALRHVVLRRPFYVARLMVGALVAVTQVGIQPSIKARGQRGPGVEPVMVGLEETSG